jgi:hypothetical protein
MAAGVILIVDGATYYVLSQMIPKPWRERRVGSE